MEEASKRLLPCDICGFEEIRKGGFIYLDKTEYVYRLTRSGLSYVYLSRPRRFGKSMLLDTLACYFEGRRYLFEGLRIADLEREWTARPVIRLDMSASMGTLQQCEMQLSRVFEQHEASLALNKLSPDLGNRFRDIIAAYADRGERPAVLIDEYDAPLVNQYVLKKKGLDNELEEFTQLYRSLFINLKSLGSSLHFVFLTGCTRFNNMSIFSVLNNLQNISYRLDWSTVCGFTEAELVATYSQELDQIAALRGETRAETVNLMRRHYDGYVFSTNPEAARVFNPFSIVRALNDMRSDADAARHPGFYWAGTSSAYALQEWAPELEGMIDKLDKCSISASDLTLGDIALGDPLLLFLQAGYLTIDRRQGEEVLLRVPNVEIKQALFSYLLPMLLGCSRRECNEPMSHLREGLRLGDLERALWAARRLIARAPWGSEDPCLFGSVGDAARSSCRIRPALSVGPKSSDKGAAPEQRAALLFMYLCYTAPFRVESEPRQAYGQPDLLVHTGEFVYIIEFKRSVKGGLGQAWRQARERRYIEPYVGEETPWGHPKTAYAVAIEVRDDGKALVDWQAKRYATDGLQLRVGKVIKSAERWRQLEEALEE